MFIDHMASSCVAVYKTKFFDYFGYFFSSEFWQLGQELHLNLLDTHKSLGYVGSFRVFEVGLNSFFGSLKKLVHGFGLGMTAR